MRTTLSHWSVLVLSRDGVALQATQCDDLKHCQGVATIARSQNASVMIKIIPPSGSPYLWD
jgi:hypothetical protein